MGGLLATHSFTGNRIIQILYFVVYFLVNCFSGYLFYTDLQVYLHRFIYNVFLLPMLAGRYFIWVREYTLSIPLASSELSFSSKCFVIPVVIFQWTQRLFGTALFNLQSLVMYWFSLLLPVIKRTSSE